MSECRRNVDEGLLVTRVGVSPRVMPLPQQVDFGFLNRLQRTSDHFTKAHGGHTYVSAPVGSDSRLEAVVRPACRNLGAGMFPLASLSQSGSGFAFACRSSMFHRGGSKWSCLSALVWLGPSPAKHGGNINAPRFTRFHEWLDVGASYVRKQPNGDCLCIFLHFREKTKV
jgi:hypothetical protein